jgi:hypothetical protein
MLKVLKFSYDSMAEADRGSLGEDCYQGASITPLDTFLFEFPQNEENMENELTFAGMIDGEPITDETILADLHKQSNNRYYLVHKVKNEIHYK